MSAGPLARIVSGGQSGVDRGALEAALEAGFPCGGWCPQGRRAEDGPIADIFPLTETPSADYEERTGWNVRDSDATLVIAPPFSAGGTAYTLYLIEQYSRPWAVVDMERIASSEEHFRTEAGRIREWIAGEGIAVLNVAGPRESKRPGAAALSRRFVESLLAPE
jgi:hypothetical protein